MASRSQWVKAGYILAALLTVWYVVLPLLNFGLSIVGSGLYATTTAAGFTNPDQTSLRSAIRNVTTDYDQVGLILLLRYSLTSDCLTGCHALSAEDLRSHCMRDADSDELRS